MLGVLAAAGGAGPTASSMAALRPARCWVSLSGRGRRARGLRPLGELLGVQASWGPAASSTAAVGSSIEHRSAEVGYPELDDAEAGQA